MTASTESAGLLPTEAREALDAARAATVLVNEHRVAMVGQAAERRRAVVRAHRCGVSIRRIAGDLGVSPAAVQRIVETARSLDSRGLPL